MVLREFLECNIESEKVMKSSFGILPWHDTL
jgi:hypothetical protein